MVMCMRCAWLVHRLRWSMNAPSTRRRWTPAPRWIANTPDPNAPARGLPRAPGSAARTQNAMASLNDIRSTFLDYFARNDHRVVPSLAARAAQRPDADVHELRHGPVQERLHRPRAPRLRPRHHQPEMRPRRRQAQRPRQRRLHRAAPHLLRDARQFLVRRLLQGARDPLRLGAADPRLRPAEGQAARHRLPRRRRGGRPLEEGRGPPRRADHPHRHLRQFLDDGPDRPLRPLLGDLLRPRPRDPRRPPRQPRRGRRPLHRDLEPRLHAVRAARGRQRATRCRARRSTPAWGSSASARCCRASTTTTTPT